MTGGSGGNVGLGGRARHAAGRVARGLGLRPPRPTEPARGQVIELDYPVHPRTRWGYGAPSHPGLLAVLEPRRDRFRARLEAILGFRAALLEIPVSTSSPTAPHWDNAWLPPNDAAALYALLAGTNPATFLEVGSGNSTKFARRAIADHGLRTRIVSIDPEPRAEIDGLCDEVLRSPAEEVDLAFYDQLGDGDVLFVDNSHRSLQNSDATVMFLDVLPRLGPGVNVQFHDIMLPDDYPPEWADRFYSEQYVLAAYLLAGGDRVEVELPVHYVSRDPELSRVLAPLWEDPRVAGVHAYGASFWIRTTETRGDR